MLVIPQASILLMVGFGVEGSGIKGSGRGVWGFA